MPRRIPGFTTWVRRQDERDDPVGDLGRAARREHWPHWAWKYDHFAAHLRTHSFRGAQKALRAAWTEYEAYVRTKKGEG